MSQVQSAPLSMTATNAQEVLRCENIVKRFGAVTALNGISLHLKKGEMMGILGDNGAGKSTMIKILTGYQAPTSGDAGHQRPAGGAKICRSRPRARNRVRLSGSGARSRPVDLPQHVPSTGNHCEEAPSACSTMGRCGAGRRRALEDIGVNIPNVNEEVAMLSGGQRQAVAIARAVYSQAKILLLDEPLAAMGARESGLILDLIDRLKKRGDLSLIMIAHNYAQTLEVCDRIMMFQHGEVTFERASAETSVPELLDVVKQNYKVIRGAH